MARHDIERSTDPPPWQKLYRRARERGLDEPDAALLRDVMRRAERWPDELADRLGWGPPQAAVVRSQVAGAVDDEGLLDTFSRQPQGMRRVLAWLMGNEVTA